MFGIDYITGPPVDAMKAAGVTFVCRYLSEVNDLTKVKILTPDEAKALSQAGIAIVCLHEWYASRPLEGFASGVYDAQIAQSQLVACGGPADRPLYFAVDIDVDGSQVVEYFRGVASVIGLHRVGTYGSYRVLKYLFDNGLITWGWQTYAWSGGAWESRAHIQQYENGVMLYGASVDYDRSMYADFGQWRIGGDMPPIDLTMPEVAIYFEQAPGNAWKCKQNGLIIGNAILDRYRSYGDNPLKGLYHLGLPVSNEYPADHTPNTQQDFELGRLTYDTDGSMGGRPGQSKGVYPLHVLPQPPSNQAAIDKATQDLQAIQQSVQAALTALGK